MGKFLEGAARDGSDVYFFQQLADMASRSNGRLIVVGILHQAFEEYSYRLSREMRDEWSKIQGRFIDLPVNTGGDEQIDLLGRAIDNGRGAVEPGLLSETVAALTNRTGSRDLPQLLEGCWPLHPVVACLLGPISRRRFGQNQRSIFGFLNSGEPHGFQDFLRRAQDGELYTPNLLWEYLRLNLEPSIMASPDGHRWALAVDALERCQGLSREETHLRLLEIVALLDMFKERSGLAPSVDALYTALPGLNPEVVRDALTQLQEWSLIIYRKFNDSYSIFEGSDFDVDGAVRRVLETMGDLDFARLNAIADLQPIVAKRHYHKTGAMRWFDMAIAPWEEVLATPGEPSSQKRRSGNLPAGSAPRKIYPERLPGKPHCKIVSDIQKWDLVVGLPQEAWNFTSLAQELLATEQVRDESPELQGDRVARREVEARISSLHGYLESELRRAFDCALWYTKDQDWEADRLTQAQLNGLASDLADHRFHSAPHLHNELLNRVKPSSNAVAARNALLRRMALHEGEERLGIQGFPAEGGLFASLLEQSGLYRSTPQGRLFAAPAT